MFVLLKNDKKRDVLIKGRTIFPRPTPWRIFFLAVNSYLHNQDAFKFIYLPSRHGSLEHMKVSREGATIILREKRKEVWRGEVMEIAFLTIVLFMVESLFSGLLLRFWRWRWSAKTRRIDVDDE